MIKANISRLDLLLKTSAFIKTEHHTFSLEFFCNFYCQSHLVSADADFAETKEAFGQFISLVSHAMLSNSKNQFNGRFWARLRGNKLESPKSHLSCK